MTTNKDKYFVIGGGGLEGHSFYEFDTAKEAVEHAQSYYLYNPIYIKGKRVTPTLEEGDG